MINAHNLNANSIHIMPLDWNHLSSEILKLKFDYILCSDLIYGGKIDKLLASTIQKLSAISSNDNSTVTVVSVHERRFAGDQGSMFNSLMKSNGFLLEEIQIQDPMYDLDKISTQIYTK